LARTPVSAYDEQMLGAYQRTIAKSEENVMVRTGISLLALMCLLSAAVAQETNGDARLEVVKYAGLKEVILKNRGKVVYVDFWHMNCPPCKAGMPHLVEMHAKHNKAGFEVVTVNVNVYDLKADEYFKSSLAFLQSIKAGFRNLLLDEKDDVWQEKLKVGGFPCVIVFDRKGLWTRFDKVNKEEIDRFVEKLLREPLK
jgi:thiol-disulfide isomerase/thioredoxin